ncbi:hypothetical protein KUTeg_000189 [Tegillarca granosa]|uniref:Ig-like domain-containing protein n=1 Tax=Tegillarca granosa TaxID=220873 RepID=A0ABQ9G174_TEGGR|nr:hypothetical protein KUTeg_000189 [Tegillarca granosa]
MLYLAVLFGAFTLTKAACKYQNTFTIIAPKQIVTIILKSTYWTFNGGVIRSLDPNTKKWVDADGTLTINEIQNDDWGEYQCFAENRLGKAMSIPFMLIEASDADMQVLASDRVAIDSNGTLHFTYLSEDTGFYTCAVSNEDTNVQVDGPKMELAVTIPTSTVGARKPRLTFNSKTVTAMIKSRAVIQCVFSGSPGIRIKWFRKYSDKEPVEIINENTQNAKFKIEDYERKLIIVNVTEAEEGQYTCTASNGVNQDNKGGGDNLNTADNLLKLQSLPMFLDEQSKPVYQTLPQGVDAVFNCKTKSLPKPPRMPKWLKNGETLAESDKYRFNTEKTQLIIKNVQEPQENPFRALDVGVYICVVESDLGTVYGFGSLNVVEKLAGSEVYNVVGTYKVIIWHKFESKEIETPGRTDSAILPPTAHLAQTGFSWWIILIVLFIIILIVLLILIFLCCCCLRGAGGGTYPVEEKEIKVGYDREKELEDHGFHNLSRSEGIENKAYSNLSLSSMKPVYIESEEGSMVDYGGYSTSVDSKRDYFDYYANRQTPVQSSV